MRVETDIVEALKMCNLPKELTLVKSDRDGATPKTPYLLIDILDSRGIGMSSKTYTEVSEVIRQVKEYDVSLVFQLQATSDIQDWLHWFYNGIESDFINYAFEQQGYGVCYYEDIKYQPNPVNGLNFKRAILDITLRTEETTEYQVNQITDVDYLGILENERVELSLNLDEVKNGN